MKSAMPRRTKRVKAVTARTNGKHKIDAASTIKLPTAFGPLGRILRPQVQFRWLMPNIGAITPQYIEMVLMGAMMGNNVQMWALFDLMLKTWPELLACYDELVFGVLRKKLIFGPYQEDDEEATPSAIEKQKLVACAIRRMQPDADQDDCAIEGTIKDILDAWFRGLAVSEITWQPIEDKALGTIIAPKATYWVDPVYYGMSNEGRVGLRAPEGQLGSQGNWPFSSTSINPAPQSLVPFPDNKFLISLHKASAGSVLTGPLLRPLAWWWCAANFSSDWLLNLAQVFGLPFRWANYQTNAPQETIDSICNMLQNMGSAGWAAFPEGTTLELMQPTGSQGSDHSPQGELLDRADRYARLLILGQTMTGTHGTTGKGGGQAFGEVEADVKSDRIEAAGDFAASVINTQLIPYILMLNYGETTEAPTLRFLEDKEAGVNEAQRDQILIKMGLEVGVDYLRKKYDIPAPAEGEEALGGEHPLVPQDFQGFPTDPEYQDPENADETKAPNEEPESQDQMKSGDKPGHEFRGNQYMKVGDYVQTPHGRGMIVAPDGPNSSFVSVGGRLRSYKHSDLRKIPYDHSRFPSISQSAEDQRRRELNAQLHSALVKINEIKDDAIFATELKALIDKQIDH